MLYDLNTLGKNTAIKNYDVCICGAGPAGITIARILAEAGKTVALLEGGGLERTEDSQNLYQGKNIGLNNWDAVFNCRLRYLGGTSNHWSGRCSFFDRVDFEKRDYFSITGWPAGSHEQMFKHLEEACVIVDLPKDTFKELPKSHWKGSNFRLSERDFSPPTRFRMKYMRELRLSEKIDLFINANLTDIRLHDNLNAVSNFEVRNYKDETFHFSGKQFVLATGATENSRLLLNFDKQVRGGIGNQHDMVGRCFMEHFNISYGSFVVQDTLMFKQGTVQFNPTEAFIRHHKIGNAVIDFDPNMQVKDYGRLRALKYSAREFICQSETMTDLTRKVTEFDCDGDGVITSLIEQTPNLDSRITLGAEKDIFGLRRVVMNWLPSPNDDLTIRTLGREMAKEFARTGLGRVQLKDFILDDTIPIRDYGHHCHQMGGTRMSIDPKIGVVDINQRVHGYENFFIAGSSIFPTGGGCNPTMTILMTSLHLAKHLVSLKN
ncbi:MAG: GMC family oxidoreductase [Methylotenera sp.]